VQVHDSVLDKYFQSLTAGQSNPCTPWQDHRHMTDTFIGPHHEPLQLQRNHSLTCTKHLFTLCTQNTCKILMIYAYR